MTTGRRGDGRCTFWVADHPRSRGLTPPSELMNAAPGADPSTAWQPAAGGIAPQQEGDRAGAGAPGGAGVPAAAAASGNAEALIAELLRRFDADGDGRLGRHEYKRFLVRLGVWGTVDACKCSRSLCVFFPRPQTSGCTDTDVYWPWTWRRVCERLRASPDAGLDGAAISRRYEGRFEMLATDVERSRAPAPERRRRSVQLEVYCQAGCAPCLHLLTLCLACRAVEPDSRARRRCDRHMMPLCPWSRGGHNPSGYQDGWLCDECGRSCSVLGQDSTFASRRFFCALCKQDLCRDCGANKARDDERSRMRTETPARRVRRLCPAGHPLVFSESRNTGWRCDAASLPAGCRSSITGFGQTDGMANWQCAGCDFDLCGACADHYDAEDIARIGASD